MNQTTAMDRIEGPQGPAGRRKLAPAEPGTHVQIADTTPPAIATVEARMHEHQQAVIDQFGDGLPWDVAHYESSIRSELKRGCDAFLRAGRYLVVARECAVHGEWQGMLTRLGIESRQAQRMMEAARRISGLPNRSRATDLIAAAGSQSKLIELLSLPEDQFAELAEEGATNGLDMDDVLVMSRDELRAAVREARADMQAKDDWADKRKQDIEGLQKQVRQLKGERSRATPGETEADLRRRTGAAALQVRVDINARGDDVDSLYERFAELRLLATNANGMESRGDEHDAFMAGLIGELMGELRQLRDVFGLPIINDHGAPDWMRAGPAAQDA